ncbi:MAG: carbohydrate binding family 9 domain-containing protein [Pseudomonadota bacterium]
MTGLRVFRRSTLVSNILLSLLVFAPVVASAQAPATEPADGVTGGKIINITNLQADPDIDGVLDEEVWSRAPVIDDFHQMSPTEYAEPTQRTEVRIFYTEDALYIGARMYETDPSLIINNVMRQGQGLLNDDVFNLVLDPYLDRRSGYIFEINPNGVRVEGIYQNVSQVDRNWTGIWQAKANIDEQGWTAEMRIPFQTISFDPANTEWGINLRRVTRRNNEEMGWISRNRLMNPSIAGTITGFSGLQQGLGLDVVPYIVARQEKIFGANGYEDNKIEPQLDVYYKVTPQLNAALTINTDFSATEVDDRVVNLSRFNLFFPERRDFFIRDSDIFQFGRIGNGSIFGQESNEAVPTSALQNGRPFFSRNIGLSTTGAPVDIDVGGKLSGRVGRFNVGSLIVRQGEDDLNSVDAQSVFVGRAAMNVMRESQIGVIATKGDPQSNVENSLVGTDFRYRNSSLPGGKVLESEVWYQQSDTEGVRDDEDSYGFGVSSPNSVGWRGGYNYKYIADNFNPGIGFVNQRGIEDHALDAGYRKFLAPGGFIRSVYGGFDGYRNTDSDTDNLISQITDVRINANTQGNDVVNAAFIRQREVLTRPFTIYRSSDGLRNVTIPVGDYEFDQSSIGLTLAGQREWSGSVSLRAGDYYNGTSVQTSISTLWQPIPGYNFQVRYSENDIELPQGDFVVRQYSFTSLINFTADITWSNRLQYDNVSESIGINSRLYWIPEPGREAYLVLNWGLVDLDKDNEYTSVSNDLTFKYNYTFRF